MAVKLLNCLPIFLLITALSEVWCDQKKITSPEEICRQHGQEGKYADPNDPKERSYIECRWQASKERCGKHERFNVFLKRCVPIPIDWSKYIKCPLNPTPFHYNRNPYDCHRFYYCYLEGEFLRLALWKCRKDDEYFDEQLQTCVSRDYFIQIYGGDCDPLPLPDDDDDHQMKDDINGLNSQYFGKYFLDEVKHWEGGK